MMQHSPLSLRPIHIAIVESFGNSVRMGLAGKHKTHPDGPPYHSSNDELRVCDFNTNIHRIDMYWF